jgi:hypothetical protein
MSVKQKLTFTIGNTKRLKTSGVSLNELKEIVSYNEFIGSLVPLHVSAMAAVNIVDVRFLRSEWKTGGATPRILR